MESSGPEADSSSLEVELRLLGPVRLSRAGVQVQLPPSRKVRALMAYLAVAPHPVSRERLCDLFWETPFDPRGELRWCLSKLRTLLDGPGRARVVAADERVWLDLDGCDVDVLRLLRAGAAGLAGLSDDELSALATLTVGDFLEGVETGASADFEHWLAARRNEFRSLRVDVVAEMGRRAPVGAPEGLAAALGWLELAPLDGRAHARFLAELFHRRMVDDCVRHLEAAEKAFAAEEVDFAPVREAWNRLRSASATAVPAVEPRREEHQPAAPRRASIAIMRSRSCVRGPPPAATSAMRSRMTSSAGGALRSMFVIARGSVSGREEGLPAADRRALGVDYVATGYIERHRDAVFVGWRWPRRKPRISCGRTVRGPLVGDIAVLDDIGDGIVSLSPEIEIAERNRAILKHPASLNAWEAISAACGTCIASRPGRTPRRGVLPPVRAARSTFSRAHAGVSFTHWQNAFSAGATRRRDPAGA